MNTNRFKSSAFLLAILFCAFSSNRASAAIWRFLPGDAYFQSELTQEFCDEIVKGEAKSDITFKYWVPPVQDGGLGYGKLEVRSMTLERRKLLAAVYKHVRKFEPPRFEITSGDSGEIRKEVNGPALFIYNSDFDYRFQYVGLRFNEDWADERSVFGIPFSAVDYDVLEPVPPRYIVEDWTYSKVIPRLKAMIPEIPNRAPWDLQWTPVTVPNDDVMFIIVRSSEVEKVRMNVKYVRRHVVHENCAFKVFDDGDGWETKFIAGDDVNKSLGDGVGKPK